METGACARGEVDGHREVVVLAGYLLATAMCLGLAVAFLGDHAELGVRDVRDRVLLAIAVALGPLTGWIAAGFPPGFEAAVFLNVLTGLSGGPATIAFAARSKAAVCCSALFWATGGYLVTAIVAI